MLLKVIQEKIRAKVKFEHGDRQAGFREGRGTRDYLYNLLIIIERSRSHQQPLYMCFVDFEKAFDTVTYQKLRKTLEDIGFAKHLIELLRSLYENQKSNVRLGN